MPAGSKAPKLLTNEQGTNDRFGLGGRPPSVKLQGKEIAMGIEGLTKRFWQCRSRSRSLLSSSPVATARLGQAARATFFVAVQKAGPLPTRSWVRPRGGEDD
jgi:hypothetical protein